MKSQYETQEIHEIRCSKSPALCIFQIRTETIQEEFFSLTQHQTLICPRFALKRKENYSIVYKINSDAIAGTKIGRLSIVQKRILSGTLYLHILSFFKSAHPSTLLGVNQADCWI